MGIESLGLGNRLQTGGTITRKAGILKVYQLSNKVEFRRDFDASEWHHEWLKRNGVDVLRLLHDADPEATTTFDYVEFSAPVRIEFEYEA